MKVHLPLDILSLSDEGGIQECGQKETFPDCGGGVL